MAKSHIYRKSTMDYPIRKKIEEEFRDDDIINCVGCKYWQRFNAQLMCCTYLYETNKPRGILPKDCYKHEGTPYTPITKRENKFNRPIFINKKMKEGK